MLRSTRLLAVLFTAVGVALGYFAATGAFNGERLTAAQPKGEEKAEPYKLDRTILPIPEPKLPLSTTLDARNAKAPPRSR